MYGEKHLHIEYLFKGGSWIQPASQKDCIFFLFLQTLFIFEDPSQLTPSLGLILCPTPGRFLSLPLSSVLHCAFVWNSSQIFIMNCLILKLFCEMQRQNTVREQTPIFTYLCIIPPQCNSWQRGGTQSLLAGLNLKSTALEL